MLFTHETFRGRLPFLNLALLNNQASRTGPKETCLRQMNDSLTAYSSARLRTRWPSQKELTARALMSALRHAIQGNIYTDENNRITIWDSSSSSL